ncbi:alginate regulatory protein AlgP [Cyanobium sp. PCC 7001]|uniref:LysM peptidoglycan-binding domain-containing protein n=1 Tax=Cyanobium sp. PCC 7001 TaxID=180281 RepID=UPI00018052D7|nr:LysM peptidoglycan-binding domain-containing protein [Cyanobium sp. PCC 7001]EDY37519.1 alginate regulatory protein AlgP [Cyanobium sp. PCC 7001]
MRRALAALALAVALPLPSLAPTPVHAQVAVRPGETLSEIAERHGVSLTRLMQANGISNPDHVEAGQTLVIPGGARRTTTSRGASVTVQPGETLSEIAEREGVSMSQLQQANGLGNADLVMVGQRLVIPGRARSAAAAATTARAMPTAPYTVKSGETLSDIATRFDTTPERLIQINGLSNPDLLLAGSRLRIPSRPGSAAAPRSAASAKEHVVSPGESLGAIAERYGTSVERLVALNNVEDPDVVHAGTRLKLVGTPPAKPTATKPAAKPDPKPASRPAPQPTATPATTTPAPTTPAVAAQPKPTTAAAQTAPAPATQAASATAAQSAKPVAATATRPSSVAAAEPRVAPKPEPKAEPKPKPKPKPSVDTTAKATPAREPDSEPGRLAQATRGVAPSTKSTSATPRATTSPGKGSGVTTVASRTVSTKPVSSSTPAAPSKESNHDWRSYGPLQVDWANWQPMGGSYVAPTLNSEGEPLYLAINCSARKVNATGQSGQWKTWDDPERDYEQKLVTDLCKAKGS